MPALGRSIMTALGAIGRPATVNQFHQFDPRMGNE
jgi:hypothetical protein